MALVNGQKPADELDSLVGSTVAGKYHIDRLIGRGGMGAVFQATNAAIGKRVALKFLRAERGAQREAARFQREALAASLAESPHIVQIFDSGQSERGQPFLVMELLTGEDLRERLRREERLDPAAAVRIGVQVLKALRQAHAAGIVHRDLKPDNVFLCRREDEPSFVKLVDFGISKLQQRAGVDTLTHEGAVLGTAFYMSPEQAQSFPDIDGRTDLYSVGAMLFEMLSGAPPHRAPTYEAVLIAICTKDAPDVRTRAPHVPAELARVVTRALSREREARYGSASEMLAALEAASVGPAEVGTETPAARSRWRPDRVRSAVLALVAATGGFALAAPFVTRTAPREPAAAISPPVPVTPGLATSTDAPTPAELAAPASLPPPAKDTTRAKPTPPQRRDARSPAPPAALPAAPTGVASGLGLSTREP
jgi:serine/threonine protein kinase